MRYIVAALICISSIVQFGCASKQIRAAESFTRDNPVKRVLVLTDSRIVFPRRDNVEEGLGLTESKMAAELYAETLCKLLSKKGYGADCRPFSVGIHSPRYVQNWVHGENANDNDTWRHMSRDPVYLYMDPVQNAPLVSAGRNVFEQLELAWHENRSDSYVPAKADVQTISKATGADTVCFTRVRGTKITRARKFGQTASRVGMMLLTGFAPMGSSETVDVRLLCAQAATGEVLWEDGHHAPIDPVDPVWTFKDAILYTFPKAGAPLDASFRKP